MAQEDSTVLINRLLAPSFLLGDAPPDSPPFSAFKHLSGGQDHPDRVLLLYCSRGLGLIVTKELEADETTFSIVIVNIRQTWRCPHHASLPSAPLRDAGGCRRGT